MAQSKRYRALITKIAKGEGRKHQASVGDVREIVRLMMVEIGGALLRGGLRNNEKWDWLMREAEKAYAATQKKRNPTK